MQYRGRVAQAVLFSCAVAGAAACGGDDDDSGGGIDAGSGAGAEPMLIRGGGVDSGFIDGVVHVHAIDRDDSPVSGATVTVGGLQGTTDATGLATFRDPSLAGAQTISVQASGFAAATWVGANGANVTIPLDPPTESIATASASGTIDGWDSLPAPDLGHYNLALVLYSFSDNIGGAENTLPQPMNGDTPLNACVRTNFDDPPCNWQMTTRTGPQVHYAIIVDGDQNGTPLDVDDDTYELIGYAVKTGQNPSANQSLTGQTLTMVSAGSATGISVSFPSAPPGAPSLAAVPFIDMGAEGQVAVPLPTLTPQSTSSEVPALSGPFAGGHYNLVGFATPGGTQQRPFSSTFARDVSLSGAANLAPFLAPPSGLSGSATSVSFTPAAGASTHVVTLLGGGETRLWVITVLDGSSTVVLPSLSPSPLTGAASATMRVTAFELPDFDAQSFSFDGALDRLLRASDDQTTLSL